MSYTYSDRKRSEGAASHTGTSPAQPSLDALRTGAAQPTVEQMGHRVDLPDAMREKMENAFGTDLSAVKLYESEAVGDAGANAIAQGTNIAFAPGMLDFTSYGGQALLGHEISHVVSQTRGEVIGGGFLNDHALEARADREGAMAAAGQQITMPTTGLSSLTAAPSAGPMQAKKGKEEEGPATDKEKTQAQTILGPFNRIDDGRSAAVDAFFTRRFGSRENHGALNDSHLFRFFSRQSYGKSDSEQDEMYDMFTNPARRPEYLDFIRGKIDETTSMDMGQFQHKGRKALLENAVSDAAKYKDLAALSDIIRDNKGDLGTGDRQMEEFSNRAAYLSAVMGDDRERLREISGEIAPGEAASVNGKVRFGGSGVNRGYKPFLRHYKKDRARSQGKKR